MNIEEYLIGLRRANTDDAPTELMRLCLFDWAVCAWAGRGEPVAKALRDLASHDGPACVVGGGQTSATMAALVNGTTGHALDYDDTHFDHIGHTSAVIMPAVLALAQDQGQLAMADVLAAAVTGSEAAVRVGLWLGRDHYQIGFHQTATAGAIGAAVGCARLLGLDSDQTANAIGLAATGASGLKGQFGTMGKPLNAGLAARCGVESALWAQAGLTSDRSGVTQLGATHHGQANAKAFDMTEPWKIARISHKFHACCHGLHAMLEALRGVTDPVDSVQITTHPRWMTVCNKPAPTTGLGVKFSYAMTAAMALSGRDTGDISAFSDETAQDPALVALRDRVSVTADDTLSEMQSRVTLHMPDGSRQQRFHDLAAPLSMDERATRLRGKACSVLGNEAADAFWAAAQQDDAAPLLAVLRG